MRGGTLIIVMYTEPVADSSISLMSGLWLPFLATVGASLTVLGIQRLNRYIQEHRQRIYAIGYMADVTYHLVSCHA